MLILAALLLSAVVLFMFGVSVISLTVIAVIMIISFVLLSALSLIFKFGFWLLFAFLIYHYFFKHNKGY